MTCLSPHQRQPAILCDREPNHDGDHSHASKGNHSRIVWPRYDRATVEAAIRIVESRREAFVHGREWRGEAVLVGILSDLRRLA